MNQPERVFFYTHARVGFMRPNDLRRQAAHGETTVKKKTRKETSERKPYGKKQNKYSPMEAGVL